MTIGYLVDLNHGGQGTTSQTANLLKRVLALPVGGFSLSQTEFPGKSVIHLS